MTPYLPPLTETKQPRTAPPPLACDCHMHIFGPEADYPYTPNRSFTPADAQEPAYAAVQKAIGVERMVVVQASVYGTDNRRTVDAVAKCGLHRARGIAMIDASFSKATLRSLTDQGIRGTRFITMVKGGPTLDNLREVAETIAEFGWHLEMYIPPHLWGEVLPVVAGLPAGTVFDHMGGMMADTAADHADLRAMLRLLESGKCWVKRCGYRASRTGHPYHHVAPLARRYIQHAPERCVWGTDWPHTTLSDTMPDDGDLFDLLADWAPDPETRQRILVENPAMLYDF
jgi:predicted TIM-barrel fold metal-dependent hydrolase